MNTDDEQQGTHRFATSSFKEAWTTVKSTCNLLSRTCLLNHILERGHQHLTHGNLSMARIARNERPVGALDSIAEAVLIVYKNGRIYIFSFTISHTALVLSIFLLVVICCGCEGAKDHGLPRINGFEERSLDSKHEMSGANYQLCLWSVQLTSTLSTVK